MNNTSVTCTLTNWRSDAFPVLATVKRYDYSAVFQSFEEARRVVSGRFGSVRFIDRTAH